ncbi:MAG TPA: hypothetical protein VJI12_03940 [archaeon]|nr:hypothetical protein [archaeon]
MKKCPYLSTRLECYAGGSGHANCMNPTFHNMCKHRKAAGKRVKREELININVNN